MLTSFFHGIIDGSVLCISMFYTNRKILDDGMTIPFVTSFVSYFWLIFEGVDPLNQKLGHFWSSDQLQVFSDYINSNLG